MALVEAPRAFLLQQAALHRLHAVPRRVALGRQRIRCAFFFTRHRRDAFADAAAILRARGGRACRCLAGFGGHGDAAAGPWRDADDHRSAFGSVLERGSVCGLARGPTGFHPPLALDRPMDGVWFLEPIYSAVSMVLLDRFLCAVETRARAIETSRFVSLPGGHYAVC